MDHPQPLTRAITLHVLSNDFSVAQISDPAEIPFDEEFVFVGKTDDELSLVCRTAIVPENALTREDGWKAIKIQGILDFSLVGILAGIASILSEARISIFAVSTYNTDYILLKSESLQSAITILSDNGHILI